VEVFSQLLFQPSDLLIQGIQHGGDGLSGSGGRGGERFGLGKMPRPQRVFDVLGFSRGVVAAGPLQHGGDLPGREPGRLHRIRSLDQQFQRVSSCEAQRCLSIQGGREELPQCHAQPRSTQE